MLLQREFPASYFTFTLNQLPLSAKPFLAGVDDILERCTDFCIRKLALHASTETVHGGKSHTYVAFFF